MRAKPRPAGSFRWEQSPRGRFSRFAIFAFAALALAGCESSQAKSARLAKASKGATKETGITVTRANPDVDVVASSVVHDQYGAAAVVELRTKRTQADLPVALEVAKYRNDLPGLEHWLTHVPLVQAGERSFWVDDQILQPGAIDVKVGMPKGRAPATLPKLVPTDLVLEPDPSGAFTRGTLRNDSAIEQHKLMVYAVAERHGKVVAAGRAGVERLKAHDKATFKVFWIGDPKGAKVHVFAPPTVLEEGKG
jgi:hypothetical protein